MLSGRWVGGWWSRTAWRSRSAFPLALLACLTLAPQAAREAGAQVIRGVVLDSAGRRPLSGVLVSVTDSVGREVQRARVDANGEFEFLARAPGWFSVRAERWGMTTATVERVDVAAGDTVSLTMALAQLPLDRLVEEVGKIVDLTDEAAPPENEIEAGGRDGPGALGIAFTEGGGVIVGNVGEREGGVPESGGRVGLVRVGVAADVDAEGRFLIPGLPAGTYALAYLRPSLKGLDWDYPLVDAVVQLGDTTTVSLEPAHPHQVMARACGLDQWKPFTGVLDGQVLLPGSGSAAPGVRVVAEWHEYRSISASGLDGKAMTAVAVTNAMGAFRFCALPTDLTTVEVTAGERAARTSATVTLSDETPVVQVTLRLPGAA